MNRFFSMWAWWFPPATVQAPAPRVGVSTEEHEADWRAGYQVGFAQGQLIGRQALADEIHQEFGLHPGQAAMTAADAVRIKSRQLH